MPDSLSEQLQSDMQCEGLLECFHGLKPLDRECFRVLVESDEPMTIDAVAEAVDRERSTAYRSVQRLLQTGFITKEQINYDQGRLLPRLLADRPREDHRRDAAHAQRLVREDGTAHSRVRREVRPVGDRVRDRVQLIGRSLAARCADSAFVVSSVSLFFADRRARLVSDAAARRSRSRRRRVGPPTADSRTPPARS